MKRTNIGIKTVTLILLSLLNPSCAQALPCDLPFKSVASNTGLMDSKPTYQSSQCATKRPLLRAGIAKSDWLTSGHNTITDEVRNSNRLISDYQNTISVNCSSYWPGWPVEKIIDQDPSTSWFSQRSDAAAHQGSPWVEMKFPNDVTVSHVSVLGNRNEPWAENFSVNVARIDFLNSNGNLLFSETSRAIGKHKNFDLKLESPLRKVRSIRIVSLQDEGNRNVYADIAIGEVLIE